MLLAHHILQSESAATPIVVYNPGAATINAQPHTFDDKLRHVSFISWTISGNNNIILQKSSETEMVQVQSQQPGKISESTAALMRLRKFLGWGANWDGDGAPAPDLNAIDSATVLLGLLCAELRNVPKVMLNAISEPTFVFIEDGFELSITVKSKNLVSFYVAQDGDEDAGLSEFNGDRMPTYLESAIRARRVA